MRKEKLMQESQHETIKNLVESKADVTSAISGLEGVQNEIDSGLKLLARKTSQAFDVWQGKRKQIMERIQALFRWPPEFAEDARSMMRRIRRFLNRVTLRKIAKLVPFVLWLVGLALIVKFLIPYVLTYSG